jgi:hypothetical protein
MAGIASETRPSQEATAIIGPITRIAIVALAGRTHARKPLPGLVFGT